MISITAPLNLNPEMYNRQLTTDFIDLAVEQLFTAVPVGKFIALDLEAQSKKFGKVLSTMMKSQVAKVKEQSADDVFKEYYAETPYCRGLVTSDKVKELAKKDVIAQLTAASKDVSEISNTICTALSDALKSVNESVPLKKYKPESVRFRKYQCSIVLNNC